jgi:hypothetical protein
LGIETGDAPMTNFICDQCNGTTTTNPENDYGEHVCDSCLDNAAERAYERHCEAFHDGGDTSFISLTDRQAEARKFK